MGEPYVSCHAYQEISDVFPKKPRQWTNCGPVGFVAMVKEHSQETPILRAAWSQQH